MHDPQFLAVAERIGKRLCRDAIWAGAQCNWTGWSVEAFSSGWSNVHKALPPAMYEGTGGVALFLGHLWRETKDPVVGKTLAGALNRSLAGVGQLAPEFYASFYNGAAGIAYTCIEIGEAVEEDGLVRKGLALLKDVAARPADERWVDICNGAAGTIQAMLHASHRSTGGPLIDGAERLGDLLLRTAIRSDEGWAWDTTLTPGQRPLLGYAHGPAGIGCALAELFDATGEWRFREGALEAFRYERTHFDHRRRNWPDFRQNQAAPAAEPPIINAWCHGAPGVGLSRLRGHEALGDAEALNDLNLALQATAESVAAALTPGVGSFCLCHGHAGNADLFIEAGIQQDRPDLVQTAEAVGRNGIGQFHALDLPWPCGILGGGETPSLMLGLAGIGYFYLRLFDPRSVPSALMIRQPAVHAQVMPSQETVPLPTAR